MIDDPLNQLDEIVARSLEEIDNELRDMYFKIPNVHPGYKHVHDEQPPYEELVLVLYKGERRIAGVSRYEPGYYDIEPAHDYWVDHTGDSLDWDWYDVSHWQYLPPITVDDKS